MSYRVGFFWFESFPKYSKWEQTRYLLCPHLTTDTRLSTARASISLPPPFQSQLCVSICRTAFMPQVARDEERQREPQVIIVLLLYKKEKIVNRLIA